jgi:DNA-binding response OmpR family regulator
VSEGRALGARVLIADDDADILALVAFRLERSGYEVLLATDGEEALRLAFEESPDLAVLDVMMPKMDGYEVTRRIRDNEATSRLPVILLTARAQQSDVDQGMLAGADDYVKKPFSPQELRARVQAVLEGSGGR